MGRYTIAERKKGGWTSPNRKLTEEDVRDIKTRIESGELHTSIARDYPVSASTIGDIARGRAWQEVR